MVVFSASRCMALHAVIVTVWLSAPAGAAESPPVVTKLTEPLGELTLDQAVGAALAHNPDLIASSYELRVADARIEQAKLRLNPELSVGLDNLGISGTAHGTDVLASTLSLSQVIEMGGKRAYRTDVATIERDTAEIEQQAQQLDVLAEVDRRFITVVAAQERLVVVQSARELSQRTLATITARVQAARSPEAEQSRARIALTRASVEEVQAGSELRSARVALAALWGGQEPAFTVAKADLYTLDDVKPFEVLVAQLERNPDFVRFASEARLRDAELRLEQAQARPNFTFTAGVGRFNETHNTGLILGFSVPLPVFNRNQGAIHEARVRRVQTDTQRQAAFLRARAAIYSLYQELLVSRKRLETLHTEALPQAQAALDQTRYGYDRGRFSYLELATAQQELLELRSAIITAAADYHRVLTEIERLTGAPLVGNPTPQELP